MMLTSKQLHYHSKIEENAGDQKTLFKVLNKLLHCSPDSVYPIHHSAEELANRMADLFTEKIMKIRIDLEIARQSQDSVTDDTMQTDAVFSEFWTLIKTDVAKLIKESATKSCILDPIPI